MTTKTLFQSCIAVFVLFTAPSVLAGDIISCDSFENCPDGSEPLTNALLDLQSRIEALEQGGAGGNGHNSLVRLSQISGSPCLSHGVMVESGVDLDDSNVLENDEVTASEPLCSSPPVVGSCDQLLVFAPWLEDGVYTIYPNGIETQAYCDMTSGGYSYLELGMGQWDQAYEGYTFLDVTELQKPTIQKAFIRAFNEQGGINAIDSWSAVNCCVKNDAGTTIDIGGAYACPSVNGNGFQWEYSAGSSYLLRLENGNVLSPPLDSGFFTTNTVSAVNKCNTNTNPGLFVRTLAPSFEAESCGDLLAMAPGFEDGVYTIYPNDIETLAYCDMTSGGYSYLELGMGQWDQAYEGYTFLDVTELQKPTVQKAVIWAFNEQGGINAIDSWSAVNCCVKNDAGTNINIGGVFACPSVDGGGYHWDYSEGSPYLLKLGNGNVLSPPLDPDYFTTNAVSAANSCSTNTNPGLFVRKLDP